MDVPRTVTAALADRPVEGAVCLEAGAGVGNTTAGLLAAGASHVYAVTNDREHAITVRERVGQSNPDRVTILEADLRHIPLASDSVELITAHGLFNMLAPPSLGQVVDELTRVADSECQLVVDDYDPLPDGAAVRDLFALENAASQLAVGDPALTFYPADVLRHLFGGKGWKFDRELTLLEPVPWTASHIKAHAAVARELASQLPSEPREWFIEETQRRAAAIGSESVGRMYSLAFESSTRLQ